MEYHRTKDLLHVKQLLGHKDLRTTLRYAQLLDFGGDEYHSATAKPIEQGFDYVTGVYGVKLFRKRK